MQWRSSGYEKRREHDDVREERHPERQHVYHWKGHIGSADLNRQEVIPEAPLGRCGEHEKHHDGAVHGQQAEIRLGFNLSE